MTHRHQSITCTNANVLSLLPMHWCERHYNKVMGLYSPASMNETAQELSNSFVLTSLSNNRPQFCQSHQFDKHIGSLTATFIDFTTDFKFPSTYTSTPCNNKFPSTYTSTLCNKLNEFIRFWNLTSYMYDCGYNVIITCQSYIQRLFHLISSCWHYNYNRINN